MAEEESPAYEPFAVQEVFLDGFSGVHINGETLRGTAFSMRPDAVSGASHPAAVVRFVMTKKTARHFIDQLATILDLKIEQARPARDRRKPR